jgi:hypothetical protein
MKRTKLDMKNLCIGLLLTFSISLAAQAKSNKSVDKIPMDIRTCMSILAKKGNRLTDYEKNYMESLGHGDVSEKPIDGKTFHNAFINELENESQAMHSYNSGREKLDNEPDEKKKN